ncbi:condensin complex subunit 3 [Athalia rosae]|uniref:condensin complex subunit 3 n=1 Tax=Athalia rosae TaxID=37344 RepID=UPI00203351D8|nr:condensin complex subunit 3 [Athalia rosae]
MTILLEKLMLTFTEVQFDRRCHPKWMQKLTKVFQTADEERFKKAFISCLLIPLGHGEKHSRVENTLQFAAKFAVSIQSRTGDGNEEELCPFLVSLFDFVLDNHDVEDRALRFRMCYFLNMLLNSMGDNAVLDDALCDKITTCMTERLLDKIPKIRAQAIFALCRLQDPSDEECPVIKAYIFHLSKDPQAEVRRAVLLNMGKNKKTLAAVLRRTRDVNDGVRILAYKFVSKVTVRSLTIEQRHTLLSDGMRDRSEKVSKYVKSELLPIWLKNYNGNFIKLLRALDSETTVDTCVLMLEVLFKNTPLREIVASVTVDENSRLIPLDKLSSENVIFWRCTVEHLHREGCQDELSNVLPDLVKFCRYIEEFMELMNVPSCELWERTTRRFILTQLFEIAKTYELSDEFGRNCLKELILNTLRSDNTSNGVIDCIVRHFAAVVPNAELRCDLLVDVIDKLRLPPVQETVPMSEAEKHERDMKRARLRVNLLEIEEEQYQAVKDKDFLKADHLKQQIQIFKGQINELNAEPVVEEMQEDDVCIDDPETLEKCLQIMFSMMQSVDVLFPALRTLLDEMVLPALDYSVCNVIILALKTTSVCCMLDETLAKKYIPIFFLQFTVDNDDIWLAALKGIFDLLVFYGLERLGMVTSPETNGDPPAGNGKTRTKSIRLYNHTDENDIPLASEQDHSARHRNIISILTGLLDNTNQDLRTIATEGLCKLLLHRRVTSVSLLSRLIILWHNPVTEDDTYLRQCLSLFFNQFGNAVPDSQEMLERSLLPSLRILANAPDKSPLLEIEPIKVAQLILHLTNPIDRVGPLAYCAHNNLALAIIAEALNADSEIDLQVLVRSLRYLNVKLENDSMIEELLAATDSLIAKTKEIDKRIHPAILHFKKSLCPSNEGNEVENEVLAEDDSEKTTDHLPLVF